MFNITYYKKTKIILIINTIQFSNAELTRLIVNSVYILATHYILAVSIFNISYFSDIIILFLKKKSNIENYSLLIII
jgi:hypothetical protein